MLSELWSFIQLGFRHITDLGAADHILFLVALAAIYRLRDWRTAIWVVTAFTVGHSVTLALAVGGVVRIPSRLIEFLIPVTIVVTCIENIIVAGRNKSPGAASYRPVFAGIFGLVHGAGFANYLRDLFQDRIALPLFGFNVGIEAGQILVLCVAAGVLASADKVIAAMERPRVISPHRIRALAVSCAVLVISARWAAERAPW
jgi:hypothetical protein